MRKLKFETHRGLFFIVFLICLTVPCMAWAVFGEDEEKVTHEFTREGNKITAKYIPRAKSTSILVDFEVSEGKLAEVKGMDFKLAKRPDVDVKDFKSALFTFEINEIAPGATVKVSLTSDFFTSSTEFWIFNEKQEMPWMNSQAENIGSPKSDLIRTMVISAKDGGTFDADGQANGKIFMVGGPKDSFWGYALGTLFIRFFGIFIVLSILMIGMMLSGKIFETLDKKKPAEPKSKYPVKKAGAVKQEKKADAVIQEKDAITPETAAAIAATLHIESQALTPEVAAAIALTLDMHFSPYRKAKSSAIAGLSAWTQQGRGQIMGERFLVFNRGIRR